MTIQTKLSNPTEIVQEPMVKRYFSQALVAIASLIIGLILGIFVTNLTTAATEIGLQPVAERAAPTYSRGPTLAEYTAAITENKANVRHAIEAETARYTSLGLFYAAGNEANVQRGIEAEAARYSAMAKFYLTEDEANVQRASEAETARYTGLATLYTEENEISGQPGLEAEAARYNGLVKFYGAKDGTNSLAWPPRPTQFHIVSE
jgi:hypothetical protein